MLELLDGPCKGTFLVKRAPDFLRAVIDKKGETDVLDQIEDTTKNTETVYIYKREGGWVDIHLCMSPRSRSGYYVMAKYRYLPDVDGQSLRDNPIWQAWATESMAKI